MSGTASRFLLVAAFTARQILARRRAVFLLVLALVPALLGILIRRFAAPSERDLLVSIVPNLILIGMVPIFALLLGAGLIRDAIEDRTVGFFLATPTGRCTWLFGSLVGLILPLILVIDVGVVITFMTWRAGLGTFPVLSATDQNLLWSLVRVASLGAALYATAFFLLGLISRFPVVIGLMYWVIVELALATMPGPFRNLSLSAHLEPLLPAPFVTRNSEALATQVRVLTTDDAVMTLPAVAVALLLVIWWRGRRRDFADKGAGV